MSTKSFDYALKRPFDLGVAPKNHISVNNSPMPNWYGSYGTVSYANKLSDDEINTFELIDLSDEHFVKTALLVVERMGKYAHKYIDNETHLKAKINDVLSESFSSKIDSINRLHEFELLVIEKIKENI